MKMVLRTRPRFPTGLTTVLDMPLDGPMSTLKVQDRSQNGNHGTIGSANTFAYPGLVFDGTDNSKIIPATQDLGDPRTFSVWFKPDGVASGDMLVFLEGPADFMWVNTGILEATAGLTNNETMYVNDVAATTVVADVFQMLTMTLDGAESAGVVVIGNATGVLQCNGVLASVFISDDELSAVEVTNLFELTRWKYGV